MEILTARDILNRTITPEIEGGYISYYDHKQQIAELELLVIRLGTEDAISFSDATVISSLQVKYKKGD